MNEPFVSKISMGSAKFLDAVRKSVQDPVEQKALLDLIPQNSNTVTIDLLALVPEVLQALLDQQLSMNQRRAISIFVCGGDRSKILETSLASAKDVHNAINGLSTKEDIPNAEIMINGRWYPILLYSELVTSNWVGSSETYAMLTANAKICDVSETYRWQVGSDHFEDENGKPIEMTISHLLERLGIRPIVGDLKEYMKRLRASQKLASEVGRQINITNSVLICHNFSWWKKTEPINLGSPTSPRKCIVEGELEVGNNANYYANRGCKTVDWPFVRVFSLDLKKYVYADIDDTEEYHYDSGSIDRLVLPDDVHSLLKDVFTSEALLFGDVVRGKHGGMVILANGPTGVGKTLTAEVFAEYTRRPLYVMEMGELGISLADVEQNLQRIFLRAARWNTVLLFDEADIFMAKRDDNLERSAIVGVFLRLLDYYHGLLFLTSNRAEVIDPAFKSRITLSLTYPELSREARLKIWVTMFQLAKITITDGLDGIPDVVLNGRQIRNMVRLLKVLHPDGKIGSGEVKRVCEFSCK